MTTTTDPHPLPAWVRRGAPALRAQAGAVREVTIRGIGARNVTDSDGIAYDRQHLVSHGGGYQARLMAPDDPQADVLRGHRARQHARDVVRRELDHWTRTADPAVLDAILDALAPHAAGRVVHRHEIAEPQAAAR